MTDTHHPPFWREHLLAVVGGHADAEKLRFLDAWSRAEGGTARWNPLNTTLVIPGANDYNTSGVKSYSGAIAGVCATAITLSARSQSGALLYPKLLAHLQAPAGAYTAETIVDACAGDIARWGTDVALIRQILAESAA